MTEELRKIAAKPRGRPFQPGNAGKPKGTRHRATMAVEALLEGEAEALTRRAIEAAKDGDMTAIKLCLDRIAPPPKGRRVSLDLPTITTAADIAKAMNAAVRAAASGDITLDEAAQVAALLEAQRRTIETADLEARVAALETKRPT